MSSRYQGQMPNGSTNGTPDVRNGLIGYDPGMVESQTDLGLREQDGPNAGLTDDRWLISVKDGQFPPPHMEWLKDFERNPDEPLKKSYRSGIALPNVDQNAPVISIAITFMAGADKPTVAKAEMSRLSDLEPPQKSHDWKVFTAATLLQRFEVGADLSIQQKDDSQEIMLIHKRRQGQLRSSSSSFSNEPVRNFLTKREPDMDETSAVVKRNIQNHTLTIDSAQVKVMHGQCTDDDFDIKCTLIEIDMFSMRDLMTQYRSIIQDGGKNIAAREILQILDSMINHVRRLCTRSPRLFRMSTRAMIAQSSNTRYGVDYGSLFVTLTTSEGIRKLVEQSSSYYLSLNESKIDQEFIRPKFMQMLILLLALLNNEDLKKLTKVLESTFQIPGDRQSIELIIMKVLPLGAINPEVFLEGLFAAYQPHEPKEGGYEIRLQRKIWEELQQDLAAKGYLVPTVIGTEGSANQSVWTTSHADDLEAMLDDMEIDDTIEDPDDQDQSGYVNDDSRNQNSQGNYQPYRPYNPSHSTRPNQSNHFNRPGPGPTSEQVSWQAPWPIDGVMSSTVFKYLQHDGRMREIGNSVGLVRVVNEIPHLEITSDDREDKLTASFTNNQQYHVAASDVEFISAMQKGSYILKKVDNPMIVTLAISDEVLNEAFVEATRTVNLLIVGIKNRIGGGAIKRRSLLSRSPSVTAFKPLDEVTEAKKVSADIVAPDGACERIAQAFKIGNRVVYREDVLREMNNSLSKITAGTDRLQRELNRYNDIRGIDEAARVRRGELEKLDEMLRNVKSLIDHAKNNRAELEQVHRNLPEDPITRVIYPSFTQMVSEKPIWQAYQSQLARDGARLIIKSTKLTIADVSFARDNIARLSFAGCNIIAVVEPLTTGGNDIPYRLMPDQTVLWLGYYIVVVEPHHTKRNSSTVQAYFKVRSQALAAGTPGRSGEMGPAMKPTMTTVV